MSYSTILHPRARKELLEAWIWYEEKQSGLGDRFENEVYKRINQIEQNPERYPERKKTFHETKIKTFPFLVIYRIEKEQSLIIVSSIFHTKRNPKSKYKQ
jgi:plasmid stabilization system protein ParE